MTPRRRSTPALRALTLALAGLVSASVAPAPQSPAPAAETGSAQSAPPAGRRDSAQALDVAFTGRHLRHFAAWEPIWVGYERPRRAWV